MGPGVGQLERQLLIRTSESELLLRAPAAVSFSH